METNYAKKLEEFVENDLLHLIIFKMGKEEYGIPINCVQEIILKQDTTHMPQTHSFVEGIINLRGRIIPIIDGKKKFCLSDSAKAAEEKIMIIDIEHEIIGLIVDDVYEVIQIPVAQVDEPPVEVTTENNFIMGVAKLSGRLVILLNPYEVLSHKETIALQSFSNSAKMKIEKAKI